MDILNSLKESITFNRNENVFYIEEKYYDYELFAFVITAIREKVQLLDVNDTNIGLITNNDIQTYATIIALWLEGKAYVPLNPDFPLERNNQVIDLAGIRTVFDSSNTAFFSSLNTILTKSLKSNEINLEPKQVSKDSIAYILFTSGTTGTPKGVAISFNNLDGLATGFNKLNYTVTNKDRCLQMFELTFDFSVMAYLIPLLKGACLYTIPKDEIKFSYIFELMESHQLTFAPMVPSILHYLRPYFDEINCPSMKYSIFCGEALPLDVTNEWIKCIPNATIANLYGPTECTVFCTNYTFKRGHENKARNGILTVGKDMFDSHSIIIDENNEELKNGFSGELCLSGAQLSPGYWKNDAKNEEAFFIKQYDNKAIRFYKTGDLCVKDEDGDIFYLDRIDFQTKIQGYRVELSEIEYHVKNALNKINAVALAFENNIKNTEIGLVIESSEFNIDELTNKLKIKLPQYMLPTQIKFITNFPLNANGKIDRIKLKNLFH